jgi:hypothetical protein
MSKKILVSFAPLITIAAFAVLPAVAQAVPHWFKNAVKIPLGKKVQTITWGTATFTVPEIGVVTCKKADAENVENPASGGPGVDEMVIFVPYECANTHCPPPMEMRVESFKLPWHTELLEPVAGEILHKTTGIKLVFGCWAGPPTGPGNVSTAERGSPFFVLPPSEGELEAKWFNGTSAAHPSNDECLPGSTLVVGFPVKVECEDKMLGFLEQELITAH